MRVATSRVVAFAVNSSWVNFNASLVMDQVVLARLR